MNIDVHNLHGHRYAHSQHGVEHDPNELKIVSRNEATTCQHQLVHFGASAEATTTTESTAQLISHLEDQSTAWVAQFSSRINGQSGGLTQKFSFNLARRPNTDARNDPSSAIAILEKYGT